MIVSFTNRFIYIAVPRTGSTSTYQALLAYGAAIVPYKQGPQQCYARDSDGFHDPFVPPELTAFFTIAGIRNPFSRMVSHYLWSQKDSAHRLNGLATTHDFPGFVRMAILAGRLWTQTAFLGKTRVDARIFLEGDIATQLGMLPCIDRKPTVERVNVAATDRPWYTYYDPETVAAVRDWARADFDAFGYSHEFVDAVDGLPPRAKG